VPARNLAERAQDQPGQQQPDDDPDQQQLQVNAGDRTAAQPSNSKQRARVPHPSEQLLWLLCLSWP